jgi:hypothetical protein
VVEIAVWMRARHHLRNRVHVISLSALNPWWFVCELRLVGSSSTYVALAIRHFLVALPPVRDLLLCAKHLFVAAMVAIVLAANSEAALRARRGLAVGSIEQISGANEQIPEPGQSD